MPYVTLAQAGSPAVVIPGMALISLVIVRNHTGSDGSVELQDSSSGAGTHIFTIDCPGGSNAQPPTGFSLPEGPFVVKAGLYLILTSVTEVMVAYT